MNDDEAMMLTARAFEDGFQRGAAEMRERCVKTLKQHSCFKGEYNGPDGADIEDVIAALPLREGE